MSNLLKYLGVIILLVGVIILAIPTLSSGATSNTMLMIGLGTVIFGFIAHVAIGRRLD